MELRYLQPQSSWTRLWWEGRRRRGVLSPFSCCPQAAVTAAGLSYTWRVLSCCMMASVFLSDCYQFQAGIFFWWRSLLPSTTEFLKRARWTDKFREIRNVSINPQRFSWPPDYFGVNVSFFLSLKQLCRVRFSKTVPVQNRVELESQSFVGQKAISWAFPYLLLTWFFACLFFNHHSSCVSHWLCNLMQKYTCVCGRSVPVLNIQTNIQWKPLQTDIDCGSVTIAREGIL